MITVLFLAALPTDQESLHLGKELKIIRQSLNSSRTRDQYQVFYDTATTVDDLRKLLLEHTPTIVHFSGHGYGAEGLCFEADDGSSHVVDGAKLAKLFHLVNDSVECVVLNACYSLAQAKAIVEHIDFVVGMADGISDGPAIKFAQGFYDAIFRGQHYEKAFKFGCSAIDTAGLPDEHIPKFLESPRLGNLRLSYSEETQKIENFLLKYLNSDVASRAMMCRGGNAVLPKMEACGRPTKPQKYFSVKVTDSHTVKPGFFEIVTNVRLEDGSADWTCYSQLTEEGFLLDWEATWGYWPLAFKTFKALATNQTYRIRVIASFSDYFNCGFTKTSFVSFRLEHFEDGSVHGYVRKSPGLLVELATKLVNGQRHRIIVDVFPRDGETDCMEIVKYVSDCWILPDPL